MDANVEIDVQPATDAGVDIRQLESLAMVADICIPPHCLGDIRDNETGEILDHRRILPQAIADPEICNLQPIPDHVRMKPEEAREESRGS